MLKKLFSYDFRAVGKNLWLFTVIAIVLAVVACLSFIGIYSMDESVEAVGDQTIVYAMLTTTLGMLGVLCTFGVVAYSVIGIIMILVRYYTNLFTDEGYLTFTLPVKTSTILNAKILSGLVWSTIVGVVEVLGLGAIYFTIIAGAFGGFEIGLDSLDPYSEFMVPEVTSLIGDIVVAAISFTRIALTIIAPLLLVYFCITLASVIAKRARVILGVGLYFGVNAVLSTIITVSQLIITTLCYTETGYHYYIDMISQGAVFILLYSGVAVVSYVLNRYLLKNKLNLI